MSCWMPKSFYNFVPIVSDVVVKCFAYTLTLIRAANDHVQAKQC